VTAPAVAAISGTLTVVRFNWPKYAAVAGLAAAAVAACVLGAPPAWVVVSWLVVAAGGAWSASSLLATWWVYDRSRVYEHVAADLGAVGEWATLHAGFDDATPVLAEVIGRPPALVLGLSGPARSSLRRARRTDPATGAVDAGAWRRATSSLDTVFLTFAVHEVRDRRDQRALFAQLHRVLRPGGRLVVTEHLRDLPNAAVFGPAVLHFQRARCWRDRAAEAAFTATGESTITPYVRRFTWRR